MTDPYATLGVKPDASAADIKRAYRELAKKYHPDANKGDKKKEARFKDISAAYDVLGDKEKRAQYDAYRQGPRMHGADMGGVDLGDLLSQMFGGGAPGGAGRYRQQGRGGSPFGGSPFGGGGSPFGGGPFSGFSTGGFSAEPQPRPRSKPKKAVPKERKVKAKDGSPLLLKGADISSDVRISLDQAILGCVASVSTLEGSASVKVPPGTSSGAKLRLKGKGARKKDGSRGNHMVTVHIDVPKKLDAEGEELLGKLMRHIRTGK